MLVGRDAELQRARRALSGGPGLVVVGEAGVGKTSLLTEATEAGGFAVSAGQCFRSLSWSAGLPLQQAAERPLPSGDPAWTAHWVVQHSRGRVLRLDDVQWADPLTLAVLPLLDRSATLALTVRRGDPGTDDALKAAAEAGLHVIDLEPLPLEDATTLAQAAHPRLREAEARSLARRCGGNPMLIEELGRTAEPSAGLRRSVVGRLRRLGPVAWHDFALLALAGEPVPSAWLVEIENLRAGGFVALDGDSVQPRLPIFAEATLIELADDHRERVELARDLARVASDDGRLALAARASAVAGDRDTAAAAALRAASASDRPGDRAELLFIAATHTDGERSADLALQAVDELVRSGQYHRAAQLLDRVPHTEDARWAGLVGRIHWQLGDNDAAFETFREGLAAVPVGSPGRVLLEVEYARTVLLGTGDPPNGLRLATQAHEHAEQLGVERARALAVLGTAEYFSGDDRAADRLSEAVELAEADGDVMVEFTSANNLISVYESQGRAERAAALADRFAQRAADLHLREWQLQMLAMAFNARMHLGHYDEIVADAPAVLTGAVDRRTRDQLELTLALALIDLGRHEPAIERIDAAVRDAVDDQIGRGNLLWARAEALLWAGDGPGAVEQNRQAMELVPAPDQRVFLLLTKAHAQLLAGEPVLAEERPRTSIRMLAGTDDELDGLVALSAGDRSAAARHFAAAAAAWAGYHRRAELRCRWLAADCDENADAARQGLLELETELAEAGWLPLLGRVRRSLRARGVRSGAPRLRNADGLTAREREVIDLVAHGLSNDAIASRLGLSPSTVAAQIASARSRLGANSRWQAASG